MTTAPTQLSPPERAGPRKACSQHEAFVELLEAHQRLVLKICWAYAGTPHDRDDLFQEIVVRLWSAFGRYDRSRKFSTWMYRVALNVAIDFRRRQRKRTREVEILEADVAAAGAATLRDACEEECLRELHELLGRHSDADRAILLLHLEGNTYREIGEVIGISESNVGTRLSRLRQSLRNSVQPRHD